MLTGVFTVSRAQLVVAAGKQVPVIIQRYAFPLSVPAADVMVNVAVVAPE